MLLIKNWGGGLRLKEKLTLNISSGYAFNTHVLFLELLL